MEYQVNINYQFKADSDNEANEKAKSYVSQNLQVKAIKDGVYSPLEIASKCRSFRKTKKEHFCVFFLDTRRRSGRANLWKWLKKTKGTVPAPSLVLFKSCGPRFQMQTASSKDSKISILTRILSEKSI